MNFLLTGLVVLGVFGICFLAMAVGLMVRGRIMRGGCGSEPGAGGSCGACGREKGGRCRQEDK